MLKERSLPQGSNVSLHICGHQSNKSFSQDMWYEVCKSIEGGHLCFKLHRELVRTTQSSISSPFLFLFLPGPPVVVMGRDLSAHLMQLMFACASGLKHRHTLSWHTAFSPSLFVITLSHTLPLLPSFFCIPASLILLQFPLPHSASRSFLISLRFLNTAHIFFGSCFFMVFAIRFVNLFFIFLKTTIYLKQT